MTIGDSRSPLRNSPQDLPYPAKPFLSTWTCYPNQSRQGRGRGRPRRPARTTRPTQTPPPRILSPRVRPHSSIDAIAAALEPAPPDLGRHSSPDGAVTLLFTDIEGSTELMERLGERQAFALFRDHAVLVQQLVEARGGGRQVAGRRLHGGLPERARGAALRDRAAAGTGEPAGGPSIPRSGWPAHRAGHPRSRRLLRPQRGAGGADRRRRRRWRDPLSKTLKDQTETDPTFTFEPLGERRFKGLRDTHEVYSVTWQERRFERASSRQPREADARTLPRTARRSAGSLASACMTAAATPAGRSVRRMARSAGESWNAPTALAFPGGRRTEARPPGTRTSRIRARRRR